MIQILESLKKYWHIYYELLGFKLFLVFLCLAIATLLEGLGFVIVIPLLSKLFNSENLDYGSFLPNYTPFKENIIFLLNSLDINKLFIFIFLIFFFKACFYFLSLYIRIFIKNNFFK